MSTSLHSPQSSSSPTSHEADSEDHSALLATVNTLFGLIQNSYQDPKDFPGAKAALESYFDLGLPLDFHDETNSTILSSAILSGSRPLIQACIDHGVPLDSYRPFKARNWFSPLSQALKYGDLKAFNLLLEAGADPLFQTTDSFSFIEGTSIAHLAAQTDAHVFLNDLLQKCSESLHLQDVHGNTAAHHAVLSWSKPSLLLLLNAGTDPLLKNKEGHDLLSLTSLSFFKEGAALIRPYYAKALSLRERNELDQVTADVTGETPLSSSTPSLRL